MKTEMYFGIRHRQRPERRLPGLLIAFVAGITTLGLFAQDEGRKERNAPLPVPGLNPSEGNPSMKKRYMRNDPALAVVPAPASTNGVPDLVAREWIIEAVRQMANTRWPAFAIGTPIPCCNIEGKLVCYHVPVAISTNHFPVVLTPPAASEVSSDDLHSGELWGVAEYWTFQVSARRSYYPIPSYGAGLPPFLVTYHKALEIARTQLNDSHVQVAHYYTIGLSEEYYDVVTASGGRVLINARNLHCRELQRGVDPFVTPDVKTNSETTSSNIEQRERLKRDYERQAGEAWDNISSSVQKGK